MEMPECIKVKCKKRHCPLTSNHYPPEGNASLSILLYKILHIQSISYCNNCNTDCGC